MASRDSIVKFCRDYLKVKDFDDYCENGLQVQGQSSVSKIITGVSLSEQLIMAAVKKKAQMIMVHHGIFGKAIPQPPVIKGVIRNRLKLLLENDISLCGFHLPLDAHPVIGNNASLCRLLNIKKPKLVFVGCVGELERAEELKVWVNKVEKKLSCSCDVIPGGSSKVKRIAVISGGASEYFEQAKDVGADTLLCGEIKESVVRAAEEAGINLINAGHYNTEKLGIYNLGNLVAKKFKVSAEFVDVPCSI